MDGGCDWGGEQPVSLCETKLVWKKVRIRVRASLVYDLIQFIDLLGQLCDLLVVCLNHGLMPLNFLGHRENRWGRALTP